MLNNNDLENILKNENLTREQKLQLINQHFESNIRQIDKELNDYLQRQRVGAALEIGSAALPVGGLAGQAAKRVIPAAISKTVGRKFSQDVAASAIGGAIDNAVFGAGRGFMENKNPVQTAMQDAGFGAAAGGALGTVTGKIINDARAVETQGINQMRKHWGIPFRKASGNPEQAIKTLTENQTGFVPNVYNKPGIGNFDIPWGVGGAEGYGLSHAIDQRASHKIDVNQFLEELPNTIREGVVTTGGTKHPNNFNIETIDQKVAIVPNWNGTPKNWFITAHPQNKSAAKRLADGTPIPNISSENGGIPHSISELSAKDSITDFVTKHNPATWLNPEIATAINSVVHSVDIQPPEFNTEQGNNSKPFELKVEMNVDENGNEINTESPTGFGANLNKRKSKIFGFKNPLTGNNRIYTRNDLSSMSDDEFSNNEKEIMSQVESMNGTMPTDRDMRDEVISGRAIYVRPYIRYDGVQVKGHYRSRVA